MAGAEARRALCVRDVGAVYAMHHFFVVVVVVVVVVAAASAADTNIPFIALLVNFGLFRRECATVRR